MSGHRITTSDLVSKPPTDIIYLPKIHDKPSLLKAMSDSIYRAQDILITQILTDLEEAASFLQAYLPESLSQKIERIEGLAKCKNPGSPGFFAAHLRERERTF